jgi:3alpha(or 20beta)-hydroxysteroid dehydrogenase
MDGRPIGRLEGKIALITGAARGQGAAEARRFAAEGARVVLADVLVEQGEALADEIGSSARFVPLDVTDEDAWTSAVVSTEETYGPLTTVVNNAGILLFHQLVSTPVEDFRRVLEVNLVGTFLGIKASAPSIERAGGGSIVNISSIGGIMGLPAVSAYVSSKFGVTGLTKSAAIELGPRGIRVNSVHPGSVDTPMIRMEGLDDADYAPFYERLPIKRLGTVDDVTNMVTFLASDESTYVTGAEFVVDGGASCGDPGFIPE